MNSLIARSLLYVLGGLVLLNIVGNKIDRMTDAPIAQPYLNPPASVDSAFRHAVDSSLTTLARSLDAGTIRASREAGWYPALVEIHDVTVAEMASSLYEGTVGFSLESRVPEYEFWLPDFVGLHLVSHGGNKWALLLYQGYHYDDEPPALPSGAPDQLPLDVELKLQAAFPAQLEIGAWLAYRDSILRETQKSRAQRKL